MYEDYRASKSENNLQIVDRMDMQFIKSGFLLNAQGLKPVKVDIQETGGLA